VYKNIISASLFAPQGVYFDEKNKQWVTPGSVPVTGQAIGVDIFGSNNQFTLAFVGTRSPGTDIIFEEPSNENVVWLLNALPNGYTNKALYLSNRIVLPRSPGFSVTTPDIPSSGAMVTNTTPFKIQALILEQGGVTDWTMYDSNGNPRKISSGLFAGQIIPLDIGEALQFTYTSAPKWAWKASW
jgi:hypothetical protein